MDGTRKGFGVPLKGNCLDSQVFVFLFVTVAGFWGKVDGKKRSQLAIQVVFRQKPPPPARLHVKREGILPLLWMDEILHHLRNSVSDDFFVNTNKRYYGFNHGVISVVRNGVLVMTWLREWKIRFTLLVSPFSVPTWQAKR